MAWRRGGTDGGGLWFGDLRKVGKMVGVGVGGVSLKVPKGRMINSKQGEEVNHHLRWIYNNLR